MVLDFWAKTSGTWINIVTVLIGSSFGLILKNRLSAKIQRIITQGIGLVTIWIGVTMTDSMGKIDAGAINGVVVGLVAIVLGGIFGEWLQIEEKLKSIGDFLKAKFRGQGLFTEGFVASSLLFCVGPMTLIGCLNNGLNGDNTLLVIKATMDGIVAIALANIYGIGVGFSVVVLFFYQGGLSLLAGLVANVIPDPNNNPSILLVSGVGGLMIMAIGFNLLEITKIRVASFLPAIAISPVLYCLMALL
ncbi:uncharacterized membrane protein, possible Na+ channel or pump [Xenococcus sp. PCC 7305]|uniref:DUF554 domain-containing protein n=1 Tax=Xenococcus sp. PCC 7305 TaxID=102125 RepID=UPI0002AC58B0|nr:DUF554 domain-containing protein [Xenococcus sp. PCC 7305]ELS02576.1 uncharacterized membrane protein, possible Na+ channel or pump [Xenococcus sp. PCC 7305]